MRIGIDARFLGPEGTGIGRYVEKLIENLEQIDPTNEYVIFLRENNYHLYQPKKPNFQKIKADARWYSVKEQIILPAVLGKQKLDLVHFPHFNVPLLYRGKFVVTIHDLTKSLFGDKASSTRAYPIFLAKHSAYKVTINQALNRSQKILVPSNFVKNELAKKFLVEKNKVVVTYEGANDFLEEDFVPSEGRVKEVFNKYSIKRPYLIFVGNTFPYKNVEVIIEALNSLEPSLNLVLVSPRDRFLDKVIQKAEDFGVKNRLITTGYVPDSELKILFRQAKAFVFPSLSEGFGLPGLEAMGLGCPVVSSDKSCLPEIYGDAAVYFNPESSKDLVKKLSHLLKNQGEAAELIKKGYSQVKKYSWKSMAVQTLKIYHETAQESS